MNARGLASACLTTLCALLGAIALAGTPAQAAVTHYYISQIAEVPQIKELPKGLSGEFVPGRLTTPKAMTVDSGELYVSEHVNGAEVYRTDVFDAATGAFISQLQQPPAASSIYGANGVAVGHGTGTTQVYVGAADSATQSGAVAVYDGSGNFLGSLTGEDTPSKRFAFEFTSIAVDNSVTDPAAGDLYVTDEFHRVVDVFKPEAGGKEKYVTQLTGSSPAEPFKQPYQVVVDQSNGDVLVLDASAGEEGAGAVVDIFEPQVLGGYVFVRRITGPPPSESFGARAVLAVDASSGEIYVGETPAAGRAVVDEFDPEGTYIGQIAGKDTPGGNLVEVDAVTVDPSTHHIYVADAREESAQPSVVDFFGPDVVLPDVATVPASEVRARSAILNGTVNPDGEGQATCQFAWGTTAALGQTAPCPASVEGGSKVSVHAALGESTHSPLEPDTTYYFRLQASNRNGTNPGEAWQDQHFTTPGPGMHGESVSAVSAESATLEATIDPHQVPTSYYFQYGTDTGYGTDVPAPPGFAIGSGEEDIEVNRHLQGLQAETIYHYRVVAVSEVAPGKFEEFDGPDQTFTTQRAAAVPALLDGRSWEMVSPPDKHGAVLDSINESGLTQAAVGGGALAYIGNTPTEDDPQGYSNRAQMFATRGTDGWSSRDIDPPNYISTGPFLGEGLDARFFSSDLSRSLTELLGREFTPLVGEETSPHATEATPYLRENFTCEASPATCYTPLLTTANVPPGTEFGGSVFAGATPDLSHVLLSSSVALTSTSIPGSGLYEWSEDGLALVSELPAGEEGAAETAASGPQLGDQGDAVRHAISDDGTRVVWDGAPQSTGTFHLYLRDTATGETVRLDQPQGNAGPRFPTSERPAFMTASADGSRIFFLDAGRLTESSKLEARGEQDLYEYDLNAPVGSRLADLTVDANPGEQAAVQQVIGASEDGSWIYFVADGALAQGAATGTNLYVRHGGTTTLIAALSAEDVGDFASGLEHLTARVSPNGSWLAFMSQRPLTGYDNRDAVSGRPDEEVYLYDAPAQQLVCASCDPSGARPVGIEYKNLGRGIVGGDRVWDEKTWLAANVPGWTPYRLGHGFYQSRYLSDSGRLFFNSSDALEPQDVDGTEDVYEYEPPGIGDCTAASATFSEHSGGCVGLVSSGTSPEESAFLDASEGGGEVFFLTSAQLLSQDYDASLDIYDAHECTSASPCFALPAVTPPPCVTGDSCKAAPSPQPPIFGAPSSATFSGAGNVVPAVTSPAKRSKPLTRAQKRARALRACATKRRRGARAACERQARKRYGAGKPNKNAKAKRRSGR